MVQSRCCPICDGPLPGVSPGRVCDAPRCRVAYRRHLEFGGRTCLVCGRPLADSSPRGAATCGETHCDVQFLRQKNLPAESRCKICRVPLPPHRVAVGICNDRECDAIHAGQRLAEAARREKERLRAAGEARKLRAAAAAGVEHPDEFTLAVVPHIATPLVPRDEERVGRVRARLESLVRYALTNEPNDCEQPRRPGWNSDGHSDSSVYRPDDIAEEASPVESPLFSAGCRLCRGACCRTGADHAYLNIGQVRQFLSDHPELSADEVVEEYLSRVPELSIENSCIFHGELGCTLPRDMRSHMCNRWLCPGLRQVRTDLQNGASPRFFIVAAEELTANEDIAAAEFIESPVEGA